MPLTIVEEVRMEKADSAEKMRDLLATAKAREELPPPSVRRARRLAVEASQEVIGDILGVSGVTVGRWERGERTPRGELLKSYVDLLEQLRSL